MNHLSEILSNYGVTEDGEDCSRLSDYGVDSLDCYGIQGCIEQYYGITLKDEHEIHTGMRIMEVKRLISSYIN